MSDTQTEVMDITKFKVEAKALIDNADTFLLIQRKGDGFSVCTPTDTALASQIFATLTNALALDEFSDYIPVLESICVLARKAIVERKGKRPMSARAFIDKYIRVEK